MEELDPEHLLALIKSRGPIYDFRDKQYNNRSVIEELWTEIAIELNSDVLECKKKWICLRNSFARYLREVRASDLRGKQRKEWYMADDMAFLRDYVNLQPPNIASIYNGNLINPDEDSQSSPSDSSTSSAKNSPVPSKKFKTSATDIEEDEVVVEEEEEEEDALMPIMKVEMKAYDEPSETKEDAASENSRLHEAEMEEESEMSEYEKPRTRRKTRSKNTTVKKMEKTRYAQSTTKKSTPPKSTRSEEPRENGNALFFKSLLFDYDNLSNRGQRTFRMYMLEKMNELQEHEENE